MSARLNSRKRAYPSTYFVQESNEKEFTRLTIQDHMINEAMGGILPEQADPAAFGRVLDVACGVGGWVIEAAEAYPEMTLVGIDTSQRRIKYARTQAEAHHVHERVEFHIMDALVGALDIPPDSFDLVNLRFGVSFLRKWDWLKILAEMLRVVRPGGVVRVTDSEIGQQSESPALTRLFEMLQCALFQAGHFFTQESTGLTSHLARLLNECGCQEVKTEAYALAYRAGTVQGENFYEDLRLLFKTSRPFIQKWGCGSEEYDSIYRQALKEMRQPDSLVVGNMITVWGRKP